MVQTTNVSALIDSTQGNGFKVGVSSRIVETSPDSTLLIAKAIAREQHELLVQVMETSFRQYRCRNSDGDAPPPIFPF